MAARETPVCEFGIAAAAFSLPSATGGIVSLGDCRGERGTVVMFICNHCPFVKAAIGRIVDVARQLEAYGVDFVAINANDWQQYPEDAPDRMREFVQEHALPFPYLYDETQEVARAYRAVCTPDFFGYNAELELQYRGRLDDGRTGEPSPGARRELFDAMVQVAETGQGPAEQTPSIGCSVKWRE